jgi:hypothetical protein
MKKRYMTLGMIDKGTRNEKLSKRPLDGEKPNVSMRAAYLAIQDMLDGRDMAKLCLHRYIFY